MRCRKNVKRLTNDEKRLFVEAVRGLKAQDSVLHPGAQSRYDDFVEIHLDAMMAMVMDALGNMTYPGWAHGDSAFLPWHRELLYRFEEELRAVKPETADVTVPYWDWTRGQAAGDPGFPFSHDFLGVNGAGAQDQVPRDPTVAGVTPYPHPFDPQAWTIVVKDGPEPAFLVRDFAPTVFPFGIDPGNPRAPGLPQNDTQVSDAAGPVVNSSYRGSIGSASYAALRSTSESIHNLVHRWVSGNMMMMTSPNDPVFWLHHAAIDRMWTIWQEKQPALTPYTNTSNAAGHRPTDNLIFHESGEPAPWSGLATPLQLVDSHAMHGESIWYDSDLPEIALDSGLSLSFGDVPAGLTTYRAIAFRVAAYRQVRFRITGVPTGNFGLTPLGTEFVGTPTFGPDPFQVDVWVQFQAIGAAVQNSAVTVEAYLLDEDGYYAAAEGGEVVLGSYTIDLTASVIPLESNAVVLVLDRSGSMAAPAGGASTRSSLLKGAVSVFHSLLRPADEIGIVSFDDLVETPLPMTTQGAGLGTVLTGNSLDPRGSTGLGSGIAAGSGALGGATHPNRSLLVLTDGNQNVHPYVHELPPGTVNDRVYAIGFGLPGEVSDAVLNEITQNTQGDLIITGTLASDEERFLLTKYFVQVLAGVTNAAVILDPQGELARGTEHRIPFQVAETDVSLDVIGLCPIPPLLEFELHTPSGTVLDPASIAGNPNVSFSETDAVAFYRLALPALPADPGGSHAGTWTAVFRLRDPRALGRGLDLGKLDRVGLAAALRRGTVPYAGVVHARSNLTLAATLRQDSLEPGAMLWLEARLTEYGVPQSSRATVWAELTRPDGSTATLAFGKAALGRYTLAVQTAGPGVYRARVRAEGVSSGGHRFTREKTLTAGVFARGLRTEPGGTAGDGGALCDLLECLVSDRVLTKAAAERFKKAGIDITALRKCLAAQCRDQSREEPMAKGDVPKKAKGVRKGPAVRPVPQAPAAEDALELIRPAAKPRAVPRPKKEDPKARRAREDSIRAAHFRDPWPTLVEDSHGDHHGPDSEHPGHPHGPAGH